MITLPRNNYSKVQGGGIYCLVSFSPGLFSFLRCNLHHSLKHTCTTHRGATPHTPFEFARRRLHREHQHLRQRQPLFVSGEFWSRRVTTSSALKIVCFSERSFRLFIMQHTPRAPTSLLASLGASSTAPTSPPQSGHARKVSQAERPSGGASSSAEIGINCENSDPKSSDAHSFVIGPAVINTDPKCF